MLFLISSNDPAKVNTDTSSGTVQNAGEKGDLDSLVEEIKKGEEGVSAETVIEEAKGEEKITQKVEVANSKLEKNTHSDEALSEDNTEVSEAEQEESEEGVKTQKRGFFSRIFGRKEEIGELSASGTLTQSGASTSGTTINGNKDNSIVKNENEAKSSDTFIVEKTSVNSSSKPSDNLVKKSGNVIKSDDELARKYAPEVYGNTMKFPGKDLKTAVGKYYEIGVHSLKLNNKYFTQKLGYLMKGDIVKQVSPENSYGCFKVDVIKSARVETEGYVCKKWLTETDYDGTQEGSEYMTQENHLNDAYPQTQIGDIITISSNDFILGTSTTLQAGDQIDQMSQIDKNGCFIAHVYQSQNENVAGKVGKACVKNIYK